MAVPSNSSMISWRTAGKPRVSPKWRRRGRVSPAPARRPGETETIPARHECGTKICREKGIEYFRRLLGHAHISTTQRYMHLDDRELAEAQDLVQY